MSSKNERLMRAVMIVVVAIIILSLLLTAN
jgi:hypothetical protein